MYVKEDHPVNVVCGEQSGFRCEANATNALRGRNVDLLMWHLAVLCVPIALGFGR